MQGRVLVGVCAQVVCCNRVGAAIKFGAATGLNHGLALGLAIGFVSWLFFWNGLGLGLGLWVWVRAGVGAQIVYCNRVGAAVKPGAATGLDHGLALGLAVGWVSRHAQAGFGLGPVLPKLKPEPQPQPQP